MKISAVVIFCSCFFLLLGGGKGGKKIKMIKKLQKKVKQLEELVLGLVAECKETKDQMGDRIDKMEENIIEIKRDLQIQDQRDQALGKAINDTKINNNELEKRVDNLEIDLNQTTVQMNDRIGGINEKIAIIETELQNQNQKDQALEKAINDTKTYVMQNTDKIEQLITKVDNNSARISEIEILHVCESNPCQNGGTCIIDKSKPDFYHCDCVTGYKGKNCEQATSCPPLPNPAHGTVTYSNGYLLGSVATYTCNRCFKFIGTPPSRTCQADHTWSRYEPRCYYNAPTIGTSTSNKDYSFVSCEVTWNEAKTICQSSRFGGQLVSITGSQVQAFIDSKSFFSGKKWWTGGKDTAAGDTVQQWVWDANGTPISGFSKWNSSSGEPDNIDEYKSWSDTGDYCLMISGNDGGSWFDVDCRSDYPFICVRDI